MSLNSYRLNKIIMIKVTSSGNGNFPHRLL